MQFEGFFSHNWKYKRELSLLVSAADYSMADIETLIHCCSDWPVDGVFGNKIIQMNIYEGTGLIEDVYIF